MAKYKMNAVGKKQLGKWQKTIDLIAELFNVPAALIMRIHSSQIEVLVASCSDGNPYQPGEKADLKTGLYCETVMASREQLAIPNALEDEDWKNNPDVALGMISYLGIPLIWPDGEIFGTICVLDRKTRQFPQPYQSLLWEFKAIIEADFKMCRQYQDKLQEKDELLQLVFDNAPVIMLTVNENIEVMQMNHTGLIAAKKPLDKVIGFRAGDILNCVNAVQNPNGCGLGENCKTCKIRKTIEETFATNQNFYKAEADLSIEKGNQTMVRNILISTAIVISTSPKTVLVTIDDITEQIEAKKNLQKSELRLREAQQIAHLGWWHWDFQKNTMHWSDEVYRIFGIDKTCVPDIEMVRRLIFPEDLARFDSRLKGFEKNDVLGNLEYRINRPMGGIRHLLGRAKPVYNRAGELRELFGVAQDVTDIRKVEKALSDSQNRLKLAMESVNDGVWDWQIDKGSMYFNPCWYTMLGYEPYELPQAYGTWKKLLHPDDVDTIDQIVKKLLGSDTSFEMEFRMKTKDNRWKWLLARGKIVDRDSNGNPLRMIGTHVDIDDRKNNESEQIITMKLLQALHEKTDMRDLTRTLTALMKEWSGCEAVGIRLQEGEDFPYFTTSGFPSQFLEAERSLCSVNQKGEILRDENGHPVLECMCGNIICGRFDPKLPFFTKKGSFWTNSTAELLASTTENDRQAQTRNRCHGQGYESVALVPLTAGDKRIGLIQFNDFRKNRFNEKKIQLFERLASSLAIGFLQRITALKLQESEERFQLAMNAAQDGLWDWDLMNNRIYYSPGWKRMLGYKENELPNDFSVWENLTDPNDVKRSWKMQQELINKKRNRFEMEFKMKHKNGHRVDILSRATAIFDENEKAIRIVGTHADITDRKIAEAKTKTAKELFQKVFNSQMDSMLILNADLPAKVVECNNATEAIFGYSPTELIGSEINRLYVNDAQVKKFQHKLFSSIESDGLLKDFKFEMKRKNGDVFPSEHTVLELKNEEGQRTGWLSIVRDITEKKEMEKRLQQAQKLEAIGVLVGGISHDFHNILFPITGYAQILLEDASENGFVAECATEISIAAKRAGDLIDQIRTFSRRTDIKPIPLKPDLIVKEVIKLMRATIPSTINITKFIDPNCRTILADPTQIHQVVMNLMTNAYQAMQESGGTATIKLENIDCIDQDGHKFKHLKGSHVLLSVSDTGTGMDHATMEKIFDPYFTTKSKENGTGLGLSIVHGIVKSCNGEIDVQTRLYKGTTFNIYIPALKQKQQIGNETAKKPYTGGTENILLVDDESQILNIERKYLEPLGYHVVTETSSSKALEIFNADPDRFDLVITDMTMPEMTGAILARKILDTTPGMPIIICTGFSEWVDPEKVKSFGVKEILLKPILKSDFAKAVRSVLDGTNNGLEFF